MGERREVRGTNWRIREPLRLDDSAEPCGLAAPPESNRDYLQRLAELLFKKNEDGAPPPP
jgi:hypothetical protein